VALATGELPVVVLDGDLVAEEPRRAGAGVGDQRFLLGQFQLEFFTQELGQALLDFPGFGLRSGEPEQMIIGLCRGPDYAEAACVVPGQGGERVPVVGIILCVRW
jgi:hypothetical protein